MTTMTDARSRALALLVPLLLAACGDSNTPVLDARALDGPRAPGEAQASDRAASLDASGWAGNAEATAPYAPEEVSPQQVHQWITEGRTETLVDVREPSEFAADHIAGAINLAWTSGVLAASYQTLPTDLPVVVYCHAGSRSYPAAIFLAGKGLKPIDDMQGGIAAWEAAGYPVVQ